MPLTITKLKMWKDPGYTRGCIEVPPAGSKKLPTPDYVLPDSETLRPHKNSTLTSLNLPLSFTQTFDMSYLYIEASDGAGSVALFGWIDSVTQRSTSYEGVTISWSVDWWRSYSGSAVFGKGRMIRTSDSSKRRPSEFSPRLRSAVSVADISAYATYGVTFHQEWCYFRCVKTQNAISNAFLYAFPLSRDFGPAGEIPRTGLGLENLYAGELDESLGLTASTITGIWLSNIPPANYRYENGQYITDAFAITKGSTGALRVSELSQLIYVCTIDLGQTYQSDDITTYTLVDMAGRTIASIPWGKPFRYIHVQNDIGSVSACYNVTLNNSPTLLPANTGLAGAEGMQFKIPLINIPLTSNAWTDYNFSGQRDHDIDMAKMQNEQQLWNGMLGIGSSAIGGAVAGSISGKGVAGAIAGATVGAASPMLSYAQNEYYRDKTQGMVDNLYSKQPNSILLPAEGAAWAISGPHYAKLIKLVADSQSESDYTQLIVNDGYNCDCPLDAAGTAAAVTAGGPLKIINLNLTGNIPPQAKQGIKIMLESGVRIIENNPSGVTP